MIKISKEKIIIQDKVKISSGSSVYVLIPKSVRKILGVGRNSTYNFVFDPNTEEITIKFKGELIGKKEKRRNN